MVQDYRNKYDKFKIVTELLAQRYLLSTILINQNNILYYLEERLKLERALVPEEKRKELRRGLQYKDTVAFDRFSISARYFNALIKKYGAEVVSYSCIQLDKYCKTTNKELSDNSIRKKLKEYANIYLGKTKASEYLADAINITMTMDYHLINDKATALQYIEGTPWYSRSLDEGCIYLKEKFNINE